MKMFLAFRQYTTVCISAYIYIFVGYLYFSNLIILYFEFTKILFLIQLRQSLQWQLLAF